MIAFKDLPSSTSVAEISFEAPIEDAIEQMTSAFGKITAESGYSSDMTFFKHSAPVFGLNGSCRLLSHFPFQNSYPMHTDLTSHGLALEFLTKFSHVARFPNVPDHEASGPDWSRCFDVRRIIMSGIPSVLVLADWMQNA